jgi:predicted transcriptional regulator
MRERLELVKDILLAADGRHMTDICRIANIQTNVFKRYIAVLMVREYISVEHRGRVFYTRTNKGNEWVQMFNEVSRILK